MVRSWVEGVLKVPTLSRNWGSRCEHRAFAAGHSRLCTGRCDSASSDFWTFGSIHWLPYPVRLVQKYSATLNRCYVPVQWNELVVVVVLVVVGLGAMPPPTVVTEARLALPVMT